MSEEYYGLCPLPRKRVCSNDFTHFRVAAAFTNLILEEQEVMSSTMSREGCKRFLAGLHVGVLAIADNGRGPLVTPVWYLYEPGGEVHISTARNSRKSRLLEYAGRLTLCVQDEAPPYKYVTIEGPIVRIEAADLERDVRPLAHRYLGKEGGDQYVKSIGGDSAADDEVLICMRPEHWYSADYGS